MATRSSTLTCLLLATGTLSGCAASFHNWLEVPENELGTHSELNRSFHTIVRDPQGVGLRFPGYLFGVEKTGRAILDVPDLDEDDQINAAPQPPVDTTRSEKQIKKAREDMEGWLDDPKRTFISHAVDYRVDSEPAPHIGAHFLYDAYGADQRRGSAPVWPRGTKLYDDSWRVLREFKGHLRKRLTTSDPGFTHLIFGVMGWNTDQTEAVTNLNSLMGNLMLAAKDSDTEFRPLFVGMTWASTWKIAALSYFNKADDADEIGCLWANAIVNDVLCELRDDPELKSRPKVVVFGHSFGARLATRAAFSGSMLKNSKTLQQGADLVIALQGAVSANRFLAEHGAGREGAPYADYGQLRGQVALTWSEHDKANPAANFVTGANNIGARSGTRRAEKYASHFHFLKAAPDGTLDKPTSKEKRILCIDASELVRYQVHGSGGYAHSDIYNRDLGRLMWGLITNWTGP